LSRIRALDFCFRKSEEIHHVNCLTQLDALPFAIARKVSGKDLEFIYNRFGCVLSGRKKDSGINERYELYATNISDLSRLVFAYHGYVIRL